MQSWFHLRQRQVMGARYRLMSTPGMSCHAGLRLFFLSDHVHDARRHGTPCAASACHVGARLRSPHVLPRHGQGINMGSGFLLLLQFEESARQTQCATRAWLRSCATLLVFLSVGHWQATLNVSGDGVDLLEQMMTWADQLRLF